MCAGPGEDDQAGEIAAHKLLGNTHKAHVHIDRLVVASIAVVKPMTLGGGQGHPRGITPESTGLPKMRLLVVLFAYAQRTNSDDSYFGGHDSTALSRGHAAPYAPPAWIGEYGYGAGDNHPLPKPDKNKTPPLASKNWAEFPAAEPAARWSQPDSVCDLSLSLLTISGTM